MTVHNTADGFSIARTLLENDYAVLLTKEENGDIRVTAKRNAGAPTTSDDILFMTHAEWEIVLDEIYSEMDYTHALSIIHKTPDGTSYM